MVQGNNRIIWLLYYTAISWLKTNAIRFAYCMILIYQYRILLLHCTVLCRVHKKTMHRDQGSGRPVNQAMKY